MHAAPTRQPVLLRLAERLSGYYAAACYFAVFAWYLVLLPALNFGETDERFRRRVRSAARSMLASFRIRVRIRDADKLPNKGPVILVANHSSWFDQLVLLDAVDLHIAFVANNKYFRIPILGRVLRRLGGIPTAGARADDGNLTEKDSQTSGATAALLTACQQSLEDGRSVVIYPEGTRSDTLLPFRRGAAVLAQQTGLPLYPVVIHGAYNVLPRMQPLWNVRPGTVTLQFLSAIKVEERGAEEVTAEVRNRIESELRQGFHNAKTPAEPAPSELIERLKPSNLAGFSYLLLATGLTALAIWLSLHGAWLSWGAGQLLLAVTMIQWWAILHEAGHKTLFRTRRLNRWCGHLAGFWSLIPGDCWRLVHARHHFWTGWQDRDMTTESLVPRQLKAYERFVINACWLSWIPLFATLYRVNNYWNYARLRKLFTDSTDQRLLKINIIVYASIYLIVLAGLGRSLSLQLFGAAILLTLALQDLLILSQHTHIPLELAGERDVRPFAPLQQEVFTRSLQFPGWFSRLILLNLDAHGLHHMYPRVPGYRLHALQNRDTLNTVPWWTWVIGAKSTAGTVLLFQNREDTGFYY